MSTKKTYEQAIEELSLMLLYLTRQQDRNEFCRYRELSWKGYNFDILDKMEKEELLWQPKSRRGYDKYLYLSEAGRKKAQKLLAEYGLPDQEMQEHFEFRYIRPEEAEQAAEIEQICFPPNEACTGKMMKDRVAAAPELFLVAVDRGNGKLAGFLCGLATDEYTFRDDFFSDTSLYQPEGKNVMLLGLDVLPEYRRQGLARELMYQYLRKEQDRGRKMVILTCLKDKVKMYEKMGFTNRGLSDSTWGNVSWYEMTCVLNI